jgi:hypothetical protein
MQIVQKISFTLCCTHCHCYSIYCNQGVWQWNKMFKNNKNYWLVFRHMYNIATALVLQIQSCAERVLSADLMFMGPCIVKHFYSKTNKRHNFSWIYLISLYLFGIVFVSIIRSPSLYIQHQIYVIKICWLLASGWISISCPLASSQGTSVTNIWRM